MPPRRLSEPPSRQTGRGRYVTFGALVLLLALIPVAVSVVRVLARPGTDTVSARLAEWARDHRLGAVVTALEQATYRPPKVGGQPTQGLPLTARPARSRAASASAAVASPPASVANGLPAPVAPVAAPPLPGEGSWHVLATAGGRPALAVAYLRPDAVHTSYVAAVVWWNPHLVSATLHPGTVDPGGTGWGAGPGVRVPGAPPALAAFNSGFRLRSSLGGYYENGRSARPLRDGAASMVFYTDGTMTVAQWGRDARLGPGVTAVRQNLALLVDGGQIAPGVDTNARRAWGATLGNAKYVWRSGIGVRADGGLVYVAGDRLTALTLADLLRRGGAVRAMELDINPEWTSFVTYLPDACNILPDMQSSPHRFDTSSSRDFVSLQVR